MIGNALAGILACKLPPWGFSGSQIYCQTNERTARRWLFGGGNGRLRFVRHWFGPSCKINNGFDTRELIANRASPPGNRVLPRSIVSDTRTVDTQGATGRDSSNEMVTLRDDDQSREIERSLCSQTRFVRVEPSRVGNHFLGRQTRSDEVIAHCCRLIKLRRKVITRDDDHLDDPGIKKPLCKFKTSRQRCGRRSVWINFALRAPGPLAPLARHTLHKYDPRLLSEQTSPSPPLPPALQSRCQPPATIVAPVGGWRTCLAWVAIAHPPRVNASMDRTSRLYWPSQRRTAPFG